MRGVRMMILAGAAMSAMLAMWFMRSALESNARNAAPVVVAAAPAQPEIKVPETAQVLVAAQDIVIGRSLTPDDLRWQAWPMESVSPYFYTKSDDPEAIVNLEGAASRLSIRAGEPLSTEKIIDLDGSGVMASLLRKGMRAISVPLSDVTGAGGFILPGDFVDLLLTRQIEIEEINRETGAIEKTTVLNQTDTIMETVRVVAIDQRLNDDGAGATIGNTATLEVTPEQAELITLTRQIAKQERGFMTLSLRSFSEMVDLYGDGLDKVMPQTVIDLREVSKKQAERAQQLREEFAEFQKRRELEIAADKERRAAQERMRLEMAAELEAQAAAEAQAAVQKAPDAVIVEGGEPGEATKREESQIVLIRNGSPIVVHTIPNKTTEQGGVE